MSSTLDRPAMNASPTQGQRTNGLKDSEAGEPRMVRSHPARRRTALVGLAAIMTAACGCVERRYTVRTEPPGAQVIVNGESLGPAPASHNYYYYGDREITLVLDGYETRTLIQPINAPWWDNYL